MSNIFNIGTLSTVVNFDLYHRSAALFPNEVPKFVIDGTNGTYGIDSIRLLFGRTPKLDIDYLVCFDEDFILTDFNIIKELIKFMEHNDIDIAGVRDGGIITHREHHPLCLNTFFNVINYRKISEKWSWKIVSSHQKIIEGEFDNENLSSLAYKYNLSSLFEPYYCFYLWALRSGSKILYLDAFMCDDNISNTVIWNNKLVGYHTWYARKYQKDTAQTSRIDRLFNQCVTRNLIKGTDIEYTVIENSKNCHKKIIRLYRYIKNRLHNLLFK